MPNYNIDDPDDEIPAATKGRRTTSMIIALLMAGAVIVFLVWFTAENADPPDDQPQILGSRGIVIPSPAFA